MHIRRPGPPDKLYRTATREWGLVGFALRRATIILILLEAFL